MLKHGPVSMLATGGYIISELKVVSSYLSVSAGLRMTNTSDSLMPVSEAPARGWDQIIAYAGFVDCPPISVMGGQAHPATLASKR